LSVTKPALNRYQLVECAGSKSNKTSLKTKTKSRKKQQSKKQTIAGAKKNGIREKNFVKTARAVASARATQHNQLNEKRANSSKLRIKVKTQEEPV
jgi:hypothetical protein